MCVEPAPAVSPVSKSQASGIGASWTPSARPLALQINSRKNGRLDILPEELPRRRAEVQVDELSPSISAHPPWSHGPMTRVSARRARSYRGPGRASADRPGPRHRTSRPRTGRPASTSSMCGGPGRGGARIRRKWNARGYRSSRVSSREKPMGVRYRPQAEERSRRHRASRSRIGAASRGARALPAGARKPYKSRSWRPGTRPRRGTYRRRSATSPTPGPGARRP